jgi:hypothetical protein
VLKHTTCDDVDGGGVKRLVRVLVRRCRRRDVDVGAVLLGTNKARKNQNPNTLVNAQKIVAKRTHKNCRNWCHDSARFFVKVSNGCQKGYYDVKMGTKCCRGKYTGFSRFGPALVGLGHCVELVARERVRLSGAVDAGLAN